MASISPTNSDLLRANLESQETENNRLPQFRFSKNRTFRVVGSALIQFFGKPILATGVCLITYRAIDRFSSPPSSTVLKVILVVGTLGFIAYHMISQFIKVESQRKEINKQVEKHLKISTEWNQHILLEIGDAEVFSEAYVTSAIELQSRQKFLSEHPIEIDEGDTIKVAVVNGFNDKVSRVRKDFDEISQFIMTELSNTTLPKDYKDMPLLMGEQTERRTKLQDARVRQVELLQQMIAYYDELIKETVNSKK